VYQELNENTRSLLFSADTLFDDDNEMTVDLISYQGLYSDGYRLLAMGYRLWWLLIGWLCWHKIGLSSQRRDWKWNSGGQACLELLRHLHFDLTDWLCTVKLLTGMFTQLYVGIMVEFRIL